MATTVLDLHEIDSISAEDLLHIIDVTRSNEDSKVDIGTLTTYLNTALSIPQTIASVNGLQAALDGKSNVGHTHTIQQIVGLSSALDLKLNSNQANIVGRIVNIKGVAITVPEEITGVRDDRIPESVIIGDYLQFDAADGGIQAITDNTLKNNLQIDLIDNTSDANKPVSTATQTALDEKNSVNAFNTGQAAQDTNITANTTDIATNVSAIALNTQKVSFDAISSTKLAGIEALADVTDTENVWGSLGISGSGSTEQYLTQRGVFTTQATATSVTKSAVDDAIGRGSEGTDYYSSNKTWLPIPTGGGTETVTKAVVDAAIGAFPTGDSAQFYNEQGNFVDAVYDSVEDAPITRNRTIESIVISGTRSNVQARETGTNETSTITMLDAFDPAPTQYTSIFTSPNTSFTPALVLPTGSQGRQLSLTEADGTVHRFGYTTNGNYRLLAGGLTGTLRLGPVAVATTATVTAAVSVPDQTAGQTITLVGDETGTFAVGDFISPQANNFGAYRGIFIDSITFDGTNTVIVGPSNGATTFQTTSILRNAGLATEVQGVTSTFSYDPDTADAVYSTDVTNQAFTSGSVDITAHLTQVANTIVELDTAITWDGVITPTTLLASILPVGFGNIYSNSLTAGNTWRFLFSNASVTIPDGTEWTSATFNNVFIEGDFSSFTAPTGTTVRLTLPNGSWVEWQTTVTDVYAADSGRFFISSISNSSGTVAGCNAFGIATQLQLEAPADASSITIDLGTESNINSSFTVTGGLNNMESVVNVDGAEGDLIPATTITVIDPEATEVASFTASVVSATDNDVDAIAAQIVTAVNNNTETPIDFTAEYDQATTTVILTASRAGNTNPWTIVFNNNGVTGENAGNLGSTSSQTGEIINQIDRFTVVGLQSIVGNDAQLSVNTSSAILMSSDSSINLLTDGTAFISANRVSLSADDINMTDSVGSIFTTTLTDTYFNLGGVDKDFSIIKQGGGSAYSYNAGADLTTINSDTILFTANTILGLPTGADGLSLTDTVNLNLLQGATVLSTVVLPSAGGTTIIAGTANEIINTVSGNTNTISLAPAITDAITANTAKTGITTAQATAITTNTGKTGITTAQSNAITANTAKTGISTAQAAAITANTAKTGITTAQSSAITANTAKVGITTAQASAITANTAKTGISTAQASAITANTAKNSYPTADATKLGTIETNADVTDTTNVVGSLTAGTNITIATDGTISAASGGTSTTVLGTANEVDVSTVGNTATVSLDTAITSAITANTAKTGITTAQATAITNNTAKTGITTAQSAAITANTAKVSVSGLNQVGGAIIASDSVLYYDGAVPRRKVFSSVPLSVMNNDANFITGITKANVDTAIGSGTLTTDYYASDKTWKSIPSGGTATTVLGTTGEIDVNTVGNTATVSLDTTITGAITTNTSKVGITTAQATAITNNTAKTGITAAQATAITDNTAKVSVAGLNQVGAAVLSTDSMVYYAGTALAPRRKTFSLVPNSIFNNDSGFTTNTGTVTSVTGTSPINVTTGTTTPVVSLDTSVSNDWSALQSFTNGTSDGSVAVHRLVSNINNTSYVDLSANDGIILATGGNTVLSGLHIAGIPLTQVTVGQHCENTVLQCSSQIDLQESASNRMARITPSEVAFNFGRNDVDFVVRKETTGDALTYDAGTDTLTAGAANVVGFGGGGSGQTGTWTPTFTNSGGVVTTGVNTYSKSGQTVTVWWAGDLDPATASGTLVLNPASLPFGIASSLGTFSFTPCGTYENSSATVSDFGMTRVFLGGFYFSRASDGLLLNGNAILTASFSFTITYQTDD